jgi:GTPase Era involved in 16S rRNA processing
MRLRYLLFSLLFNMLSQSNKTRKQIKGIKQEGRSQIVYICKWDDPIFKRPLRFHQKTPRSGKHFWQGIRIQIEHTKISCFSIYNNKQVEREIRKIFPFTITSKFKCLGINLTKEMKQLYNKNCETMKKVIEENTRKWKDLPCSQIGVLILWK